ncbi:MAG: hypothetical protein ACT4P7_02375 [Gemmatimonadaceae bacterium]
MKKRRKSARDADRVTAPIVEETDATVSVSIAAESVLEPVAATDPAEEEDEDLSAETFGDAIETRDRNPRDERLGRDALDDHVVLGNAPDDLSLDAVDEIAAGTPPDEYITAPSGDRRPRNDEAEMGLGGEPHSADELAERAIGHEIKGPRGTTRDGEAHGRYLGLR